MTSANTTARREAAALLALALAWAGAEALIRWKARAAGVPPSRVITPAQLTVTDRDLPFVMGPELDAWSPFPSQDGEYVRMRTDPYGFRSPGVATAKPAGTSRVVLMGYCSMQEVGSGTPEGYGPCTRRLQALLESSLGSPVEVLNAATGGYDLLTEVAQYLFKIRLLHPDLIILEPELFDSPDRPLRPVPGSSAYDLGPLVKARSRLRDRSLALEGLIRRVGPGIDRSLRGLLDPPDPGAPTATPDHAPWVRDVVDELGVLAALLRHDGVRLLVQPPATWLREPSARDRIEAAPGTEAQKAELLDKAVQVRLLDAAVADWARREGIPLVDAGRLPSEPEDFLVTGFGPSPDLSSLRGHLRRAEVLARDAAPLLRKAAP